MKRSVISLVLIVCLCTLCAVPAYAADERPSNSTIVTNKQIQREIETKKAETMASVSRQLEAQGKLHMLPDYEEILLPEIEAEIYAKYNKLEEYSLQSVNVDPCYFPYGGTIANVTASGRYALSTFMIPDDTLHYLLVGNTDTIGDMITAICGFLPIFGPVFTLMFTAETVVDKQTRREIDANGGYSRTLVLRGDDNSSVLLAWDTHPHALPYAYTTGMFEYEEFPPHDTYKEHGK